jgi:hypothetical protein
MKLTLAGKFIVKKAVYDCETVQDVAAIFPEDFHAQLKKLLSTSLFFASFLLTSGELTPLQ